MLTQGTLEKFKCMAYKLRSGKALGDKWGIKTSYNEELTRKIFSYYWIAGQGCTLTREQECQIEAFANSLTAFGYQCPSDDSCIKVNLCGVSGNVQDDPVFCSSTIQVIFL